MIDEFGAARLLAAVNGTAPPRDFTQPNSITRAVARILDGRHKNDATLKNAFTQLKHAIFKRYGESCVRCNAQPAKWLVKKPEPDRAFGGICSDCKRKYAYDVITWQWLANGDAGLLDMN
jgi:hypothetical protein